MISPVDYERRLTQTAQAAWPCVHQTGSIPILDDRGYRGIATITTPARHRSERIIHDDDYRVHRRVRSRVEHVLARLKDWQNPPSMPPPRLRHQPQPPNNRGLWNLKTNNQLRVNS